MTRKPEIHKPLELVIGGWLNDLKLATANSRETQSDIEARIAVMTAGLMHDFPDPSLFNKESLFAISRQNTFFPSLGDLCKQLGDWRDAHRPKTFIVPNELIDADLSPEDRMNVRLWLEHYAAGDLSNDEMVIRLSIIRRYARKGYHWLLERRTDAAMAAASIAVRQHWVEDENKWSPPTDEEREAVALIVSQRFPTVQQQVDMRADDGHSGAVPSRPLIMPRGRVADSLSEEHLRALRAKNPGLRAVQEREDAKKAAEEGRKPWYLDDDR